MSSRAGLDRDTVVRAAADLIDEAGGEVTMAALATHLGVRTPSLYNHVDGQDGLRRELALLGSCELGVRITRAAVGKSADDALLAVAYAYRGFARERPGLYSFTLRAPDPEDREYIALADEIVSVVADVVATYGLEGDVAIHAIRGLRSILHGFVTLETSAGFGIPVDLDESFEYAVRMYIRGFQRDLGPATN